jgi:hypothetical protein
MIPRRVVSGKEQYAVSHGGSRNLDRCHLFARHPLPGGGDQVGRVQPQERCLLLVPGPRIQLGEFLEQSRAVYRDKVHRNGGITIRILGNGGRNRGLTREV